MIQPNLQSQKPAQPLLGAVLVVLSVFTGLSLISYSPYDPSWSFASDQIDSIQNFGGLVGSWLADALFQSLGVVAYILTIGSFWLGLQKMRPRKRQLEKSSKARQIQIWKASVAVSLSIICLSGLLSLTPWQIHGEISFGGFLGYIIANFGTYAFSQMGAAILFLGGIWISAVMVWDRIGALPSLSIKLPSLKMLTSTLKKVPRPSLRKKPKTAATTKPGEDISESLEKLFASTKQNHKKQESSVTNASSTKKEPPKTESPYPLFSFGKKKDEKPTEERKVLVDQLPKPQADTHADFQLPDINFLDLPEENNFDVSREELIENSKALEQKLLDFGIQGQVTNIRPGPIITLYEFEPAPGVKVKTILNLTDDLKLAMKALSIRIIAPIPGKAAVGVEIPNQKRQTVYLRDILESPMFQNSPSPLSIGLGKTTSGEPYIADLAKMPHLLIAGSTGSGKSVGLNAMIVSMLYKGSPEELKFIMIDPKMLELSVYEGIPHLLLPVVTDPKKSARALSWAVKEMERRYKLISSLGARNLKSYNQKVEKLSREELEKEIELAAQAEASASAIIEDEEGSTQKDKVLQEVGLDHYVKLPNICIVIDELADLIMVAAREVEDSIARLAQMARAAGIHLIIATQRPSVDVITGVIKANFPTRCAYQVASKVDSRTIIDGPGAENLIGDGDMLFMPPGTSQLERLHGPFISEDEIEKIARHLQAQSSGDYYTSINLEEMQAPKDHDDSPADDEIYNDALQVVLETQSPSASMLQRRLRIGYNRAARLVERMEHEGIVSAPLGGGKGRELLLEAAQRD